MKWIKRLLRLLVVVVLLCAVAGGVAWTLAHRRPSWYPRAALDPAAQAAAAQRADDKVADTLSWAADGHAADIRARNALASGATPAADARQPRTITFTEEELNAFFAKWAKLQDWDRRYAGYVTDPVVILDGGRLILAGTSTELGTVVSLHFEPKLDAHANLQLELVSLRGGELPLPESAFAKYRRRLEQKVRTSLPDLQRRAKIDTNGSYNGAAIAAAMGKLALRILNHQPGEPILFLPVGTKSHVPVRLTAVKIEDKSLQLTIEALSAEEREAMLQRIREPYGTATALND